MDWGLMPLPTHLHQYCESQLMTLRHLFIDFLLISIFSLCPCLQNLLAAYKQCLRAWVLCRTLYMLGNEDEMTHNFDSTTKKKNSR